MKIDSTITLAKGELSYKQMLRLLKTLTFTDADDIECMAYDYNESKDELRLPRGVWSLLPSDLDVIDLRSRPPMPKLHYTGTLDAEGYEGQTDAVRAMFEHEYGQVIAPPGRGKTEIVLAFAAAAKTRTLVVVHTRDLFEQWVNRLAVSVPGASVGKIQGTTCQVGHITIAMAQTLKRYLRAGGKFWRKFGCVVVDEAHHAAAETWEWLLNMCPAYYRFGVTATARRADGRHPLVKFNIGPVIYKIKFESQVPLKVVPVETGFRSKLGGANWSQLMRLLVNDKDRNAKIAEIAVREMNEGNSVLILSRQIKHLEHIDKAISDKLEDKTDIIWVSTVTGRVSQRRRDMHIETFRLGVTKILLATQLADEGLDVPRLNRVLLTFPGKHDGRIIQQIGRSIRKHPDKTDAIVYDFVDDFVSVLGRQYVQRKATYKSLGIEIGKVERNGGQQTAKKGRKLRDLLEGARTASLGRA